MARTFTVLLAATFVMVGSFASAASPTTMPAVSDAVRAKADKSLAAGAKYLLSKQEPDGSWGGKYGPAITAMAVKALVQAGEKPDSPAIKKAMDFIVSKQVKANPQLDQEQNRMRGSFSTQELANYNTAICVSTLVMMNKLLCGDPYDHVIKDALDFLRRDQWDESEQIDKTNPAYGGFGYGGGQRPDMSNTGVTMDALKALKDAGYVKEDDPMFEKVRIFVERSQNRTESNKVDTFIVGDDGGFIYTPALSPTKGGAESKAGGDKSKLRSYGSMTYMGFKSFVYSGLSPDDPRVKAAYEWMRQNFTLAENPGIDAQGLYYYYHAMARALHASGQPRIKDAADVNHDWRVELVNKLTSLQKEDGSWVNEKADRWEEGNPILATCFAMLAMEETVR